MRNKFMICRRADRNPTREDRLCSCHFVNGDKTLGPTIFPWNKEGIWEFPAPEQSKRKRKTEDTAPLSPLQVEIPQVVQPTPSTSTVMSPALDSAEIFFLREENKTLKQQLKEGEKRFSFKDISSDDSLVFKYTGLPTSAHVLMLSRLLLRFKLTYYCGWKVDILSHVDQLFCTLVKLRLNLHLFDLAYRFKVSDTTIQNIVITYLYYPIANINIKIETLG
ncbi:hypothetical protein RN001_002014 [Aquatica leii]|uniref:Transposase Helix-turn-helix domain-containing protein n=1 Tax=Aquatica leii TaxID=1421715 RepID=A0AAN7PGS8_9COLE|nr:hypothetical protein RN001_002014 [Aquatica leii]